MLHNQYVMVIFALLHLCTVGHCSESSAILDEPPSRSSAWRFFFNTSQNPLDGYTNCGGFDTQWNLNQGKCGVCGDPYNAPVRDNELPDGNYTEPLMITRTYKTGTTIYAKVHVIENHQGHFEFRLCKALNLLGNDTHESHVGVKEVTQECLDQNILEVMGSSDKHRWVIPTKDNDVIYAFRVKLPVGLTCERCVFQWTWITNERAGDKQTTHKACADVKIIN